MYIVILKHVSAVSSGSYWNIIFDITHGRQHIQNWMHIFPVSLYNRIPAICEKACKEVSLRNFTSHYIPSSICAPLLTQVSKHVLKSNMHQAWA